MAPNSLHPAYVLIEYHSPYGQHKQIVPTTDWFPTSIVGSLGSYLAWNGVPCDAEAMVNDLVDSFVPLALPTTVWDLATVYTIFNELIPEAIPRASVLLSQIGSSTATSQSKAVQNVYTFKDDQNKKLKIYQLDTPTVGGAFEKINRGAWNATMIAIETALKNVGSAWATRNGRQIVTGISCTSTLNEKLRKEYRMA